MKILITGSTGFVGRYIANKLSKKYELILPVRNFKKAEKIIHINEKIKLIQFSEDLDRIVIKENPDIVINLLGILKEDRENGVTFEKVHYTFTEKLVNGAVKAGVKHFIQMSALGADINSKSRYLKTKAAAEKYLKSSNLKYSIFRPSIIIGKEQLLFEEFKKFSKIAPFFLSPKGKVQPVHILDVRDCFVNVVENFKQNNIYELCGKEVITYKKLFEFALEYIGEKKPVIEVSRIFLLPVAILGEYIKNAPLTYDQWLMLEKDNICSGKYEGVKSLLGSVRDAFNLNYQA
jgi:NADH dehydrogenase